MRRWLRRLVCLLDGHQWSSDGSGESRRAHDEDPSRDDLSIVRCVRCGRESEYNPIRAPETEDEAR